MQTIAQILQAFVFAQPGMLVLKNENLCLISMYA